MSDSDNLEYVGFWARVGASLIDTLALLILTVPLTYTIYESYSSPQGMGYMGLADVLINLVLPAVIIVAMWVRLGATPGKMAMSARVVDADTGEPLTLSRALLRYVGYFVATMPLGIGILWVAFDRRKQGWHDKMANSVVIRPSGDEKVSFSSKKDWREVPTKPSEPKF